MDVERINRVSESLFLTKFQALVAALRLCELRALRGESFFLEQIGFIRLADQGWILSELSWRLSKTGYTQKTQGLYKAARR